MRTPSWLSWVVAATLLVACDKGGEEPKTGDDAADGTKTDGTSTPSGDGTATPDGGSTDGGGGTKTDTPASGGGDKSGPKSNEAPKDPSALVLELKYAKKGGGKVDDKTSSELQKAALEKIKTSAKLASPDSKVDKPRRVTVTVMIEDPKNDKKGLTIKMGLVGVEPDGKCPLFDLDQNFTMTGGKGSESEVLDLQRQAIQALLEKLEVTAPTLKPTANCSGFKSPNK